MSDTTYHVRAPRDSVILALTPDDARWLREEMIDREEFALERVTLHRTACAVDLLARVRALKLTLEDELGIDAARPPEIPIPGASYEGPAQ